MSTYNLLTKRVTGKEYLISDFIATKLNRKQFENVQSQNEFLKEYTFTPYSETDFSWWSRVFKKLTAKKLYSNVEFDCDFYGNVTEVL